MAGRRDEGREVNVGRGRRRADQRDSGKELQYAENERAHGKRAGRTRRDWESVVGEVALRHGRERSGQCQTFTGVLRR